MLTNVVSTYLARFAAVASTFILLPLVANAVGIEEYGLYALVAAMGILFSQDFGMASATIKFIAEARARGENARMAEISASSTTYFLLIGVLVALGLSIAFALIVPSIRVPASVNVSALLVLGVANATVGMAMGSHRQILAGFGRLDLVNLVQIGQAVARILLTLLVLSASVSVVAVAAVDLFTTTAGGLACWVLKRRLAPSTITRWAALRWRSFRELFVLSADILIMTVAAVVILQAGTVIASLILPLGAVAVYTAANRAFLLVREAANSLTLALLPTTTARSAVGNSRANATLFVEGTRLANSAMLTLLVPITVFAWELLTWWVGPELASGYVAAQILIVSLLANNNHIVAIPILTGAGRIRSYAVLHATWAVLGVVLASALAPAYGVVGIAVGLSVPILLLEPLYVWFACRYLGLSITGFLRRAVVTPYGLAAIPTAALIFAKSVMAGGPASSVAIMAVWSLTMGLLIWCIVFRAEDRARLLRITRRGQPRPGASEG